MIALPLQGQALKNGNSAFVDENWNAYPDQWDALFNKTRKLGIEDVEQCMAKWQGELAEIKGTLTNIEKNAVSYTHLDVYKRQVQQMGKIRIYSSAFLSGMGWFMDDDCCK